MTGYQNKKYAFSLSEIGAPVYLKNSGAWVIERTIPNTNYKDAMGCYPLFACENWAGLAEDIESKRKDWISFSIVTDPFGRFCEQSIKETFTDKCFPFKNHFAINLQTDWQNQLHKNHLRKARKAIKSLDIELVENPFESLDDWDKLYKILVARHNIKGMAKFSGKAFVGMFETPGLYVYKASLDGEIAGMVLFYEMDEVVYYHLGAYSDDGYRHNASFGLFFQAIKDFSALGKKWLNLGSGAGTAENENDGLTRFKKGWSSETRTTFFCGKILNKAIYTQLANRTGAGPKGFFPAYRNSI